MASDEGASPSPEREYPQEFFRALVRGGPPRLLAAPVCAYERADVVQPIIETAVADALDLSRAVPEDLTTSLDRLIRTRVLGEPLARLADVRARRGVEAADTVLRQLAAYRDELADPACASERRRELTAIFERVRAAVTAGKLPHDLNARQTHVLNCLDIVASMRLTRVLDWWFGGDRPSRIARACLQRLIGSDEACVRALVEARYPGLTEHAQQRLFIHAVSGWRTPADGKWGPTVELLTALGVFRPRSDGAQRSLAEMRRKAGGALPDLASAPDARRQLWARLAELLTVLGLDVPDVSVWERARDAFVRGSAP